MTPIGSAHAGRINRLNQFLGRQLGDTAIVSGQNPIRLAERSEPQPDIAVLRPRADYYAEGHPTAADVLLVIELADTSLAYDRDVKVPLYTRAGIPEAWLFDVPGESITRYADPVDGTDRLVERARRGQRLASTVLPALVLEVDAVL